MIDHPIQPVRPRPVWPALLLITAVITGLNAIKPLTIDDGAYAEYARQIAHHPLDPYGFQIFWTQWPEPANNLLVPPVIPYWWAIAMRWFGPSVVIWKLWLLPWVGAFVFSVHALLRRFAPAVALPMTVFTAFAPVYLPAVNYMLDVPALGLGLAALCVSMRAMDRRSVALAMLAGIMFGVSLQTKYNVATLPAMASLYGFSRRRFLLAVLPGLISLAVFSAWELYVAHTYGQSHFLLHLHGFDLMIGNEQIYFLFIGAGTLAGGLAGPLALLMALGLGVPRRWLAVGAGAIVFAFALTAATRFATYTFGILGMAVSAVAAISLWALLRGKIQRTPVYTQSNPSAAVRQPLIGFFRATAFSIREACRRERTEPSARRDDFYLIAWFVVEVLAYFAISPFAASRRVMGIILVLTLVTARLLEGRGAMPGFATTTRWLIRLGVAIGLLFFAIDWIDADAERQAVASGVAVVRAHRKPGQAVYFKGHWGFQFYCEAAGLQPIVSDHTLLKPGDWVLFPSWGVNSQLVGLLLADIEQIGSIQIDDPVKLETIPAFYGRLIPLDHRTGPLFTLDVYQVKTGFTPETFYKPDYIRDWAISRRPPLMPLSVRAVLRSLKDAPAAQATQVKQAVARGGPDALIEASHDPDPQWRAWAIQQLQELPRTPAVAAALAVLKDDVDAAVRAAASDTLAGRRPVTTAPLPVRAFSK